MGMFSWDCPACGFSIRDCRNCSEGNWMNQGVVLTPDGSRVFGEYNSYGQLGEYNLVDQISKFALYHRACWELIGKPEYTKPSCGARDQGFCLPTHGTPWPRPTKEWLEVFAPMWHAIERVVDAYCELRADQQLSEVLAKVNLFTNPGQARLFDEYRAEEKRRHEAERARQEAWYTNPDLDAIEPPKLEWPKEFVYECITFDWGWLGVVVARDDNARREKDRLLKRR